MFKPALFAVEKDQKSDTKKNQNIFNNISSFLKELKEIKKENQKKTYGIKTEEEKQQSMAEYIQNLSAMQTQKSKLFDEINETMVFNNIEQNPKVKRVMGGFNNTINQYFNAEININDSDMCMLEITIFFEIIKGIINKNKINLISNQNISLGELNSAWENRRIKPSKNLNDLLKQSFDFNDIIFNINNKQETLKNKLPCNALKFYQLLSEIRQLLSDHKFEIDNTVLSNCKKLIKENETCIINDLKRPWLTAAVQWLANQNQQLDQQSANNTKKEKKQSQKIKELNMMMMANMGINLLFNPIWEQEINQSIRAQQQDIILLNQDIIFEKNSIASQILEKLLEQTIQSINQDQQKQISKIQQKEISQINTQKNGESTVFYRKTKQ